MVYVIKKGFDPLDPATLHNPAAIFIQAEDLVNNGDGSVSFRTRDIYFGQEPNAYGVRNDNNFPGPYQKFTKDGAIVTTVTRPGDQLYAYVVVQGRSY